MADKLVEISRYYGFDGWLVNIENVLGVISLGVDRLMIVEEIKMSTVVHSFPSCDIAAVISYCDARWTTGCVSTRFAWLCLLLFVI